MPRVLFVFLRGKKRTKRCVLYMAPVNVGNVMNFSNINESIGTRPRSLALLALVFVAMMTASGCGQKGSLYLPDKAKATYSGAAENSG